MDNFEAIAHISSALVENDKDRVVKSVVHFIGNLSFKMQQEITIELMMSVRKQFGVDDSSEEKGNKEPVSQPLVGEGSTVRSAILAVLSSADKPLSTAEIYDRLSAVDADVNRNTVSVMVSKMKDTKEIKQAGKQGRTPLYRLRVTGEK
jgi:hypothetical protein